MAHFHRTIRVNGRVQGVGFRASAMEQAERLGLCGTARNLPSGGVEIQIEGESELVEVYTRWARRGPTLARVDEIQATDGPLQGLTGHRIIR